VLSPHRPAPVPTGDETKFRAAFPSLRTVEVFGKSWQFAASPTCCSGMRAAKRALMHLCTGGDLVVQGFSLLDCTIEHFVAILAFEAFCMDC
jgi:hypothetical protein